MRALDGKVAVVTGASSGIGWATALTLASAGARVVASSRREDKGRELLKAIRDRGGEATWFTADMQSERDIEALCHTAVSTYGRLDCAFNNAGAGAMNLLTETSNAEYELLMNSNVRSVFWCMKYQLKIMLASGGGSIVNCASVGAHRAMPGLSIYSTTKAAVVALTRGAAVEYAQQHIRVNSVSPGVVESEMATSGWRLDTAEGRAFASSLHPIGDAEVRRALGPISRDELRHAELAWAVDAWAAGRLTPLERERIRQLRRETLSALEHEVGSQPPPEHFVREAGVPSREQALSLLQGLAGLVV